MPGFDKRGPDCVMLAAGNSERMGTWKMILPFGRSTIIETSVENALGACGRVILVTGYSGGSLAELFAGNPRVRIVHNENWEKGMFSSVREGMRSVETADFFLALGDMPLVTPEVYRLLRTFQLPGSVIPQCGGKKGHPVRFDSAVIPFALSLAGEDSLRSVIARYPSLVVPVDNPGVLSDIDTPEQYRERSACSPS
jgi:molybdenum cofactor cytidylyltransferase